jgi:CheY-like chemotaxis protein
MSSPAAPCVLVVADPPRLRELADALADPLERGPIKVVSSTGGDDTIDLFEEHHPHVVVVTASLELGDTRALIEALRAMLPRAEVGIVLVGDDTGPIRTALDALEHAPDRFLTRPLSRPALRYAVTSSLDAVTLARGSGSGEPPRSRTRTDRGTGVPAAAPATVDDAPTASTRAALRARWEAIADSIRDEEEEPTAATDEVTPLPPPVVIQPRRRGNTTMNPWRPGTTAEVREEPEIAAPPREPTLIIPERPSEPQVEPSVTARTSSKEDWSPPVTLSAMVEEPAVEPPRPPPPLAPTPLATPPPSPIFGGHDFARQLREKMSMMAQRLFQADATPPVDITPRHDHHTEIDLALLAEEPALGGGVTEIERASRSDSRETSPGTWETQIRERGVPDEGEIARGTSDAPMLLARMFAQGATGRITFRHADGEKVVFFDQGRPVFASSKEPGDRMGELLVREGKITAAQYERCQQHATSSGRRMGEILVDFGYLKRRELLPAVRRHVEDLLYSLFGWDRGTYRIHIDSAASAERIRLSRHPAALILEGIRRKLDRTTLEKLVGPPSTVIEVPDKERLGGIVNVSDLAPEERAALGAFDAQADLAHVARAASIDVTDLLPLAWGLCVLGLATARRTETEPAAESTALVGEADLEIDRERVRARWRLVSEADYFALLGVRRNATAFEIRRAYQSARRDFASDCFPNDLRRELAQELDDIAQVLDEAFRVLRDDRLRETYLSNLIE